MREAFRYFIFVGLLTLALFVAPFDLISTAQLSGGQATNDIASALDDNQNRVLDDAEILNAIQLWILGEAMPGGEVISDESILSLVQLWITGETISLALMSDDDGGDVPAPTRCTEAAGTFLSKFGETGTTEDHHFYDARGIAADNAGNVYVSELELNAVKKFDVNGAFVSKWFTKGSDDVQRWSPRRVAVDSAGNIYVSHFINLEGAPAGVQKFSADGTFLTEWGSRGSGDGRFSHPIGVAVDSKGNVYVADSGNHRIQKFDSDGTYLTQWSLSILNRMTPSDIAVDSQDNIYVSDTDDDRILKFDSEGKLLTEWGKNGFQNSEFQRPIGVAVDHQDNVYVADADNHRVQKFDANGTFLTTWGSQGNADGQLSFPHGLAVDRSGHVYVADSGNNRIQKFCGGMSPVDAAP